MRSKVHSAGGTAVLRDPESLTDDLDIEGAETPRRRVLQSAIDLFSTRGFDGVSVRDITTHAGTNLAAVNYYFGSKDILVRTVFKTAAARINGILLERLTAYEQSCESARPELEPILRAHAEPLLRCLLAKDTEDCHYARIYVLGTLLPPPSLAGMFSEGQNDEIVLRFIYALSRALPQLSLPEIYWRFYFTTGAVLTATRDIAKSSHFRRLSGGACNTASEEEVLRALVPFIVTGFSRGSYTPCVAGPAKQGSDRTVRSRKKGLDLPRPRKAGTNG